MRRLRPQLTAFLLALLVGVPCASFGAVESWYPSQNDFATWAFEDRWPSLGDHDFNDLVIYYRVHYQGTEVGVTRVAVTARVMARGASVHSGFGLRLPVAASNVSSAVVSRGCALLPSAAVLEPGHATATFVLFSDAFEVLPQGACDFVNTVADCAPEPAQEMLLDVALKEPVTGLAAQDLDPFLFASDHRGREVHLPGFAPTVMADAALFGTGDDATAVLDGQPVGHYYLGETHLPWALDLATPWQWPHERTELVSVYPDFAVWAGSAGGLRPGWYLTDASNVITSLQYDDFIDVDGVCVCPANAHPDSGACTCDEGYAQDAYGNCIPTHPFLSMPDLKLWLDASGLVPGVDNRFGTVDADGAVLVWKDWTLNAYHVSQADPVRRAKRIDHPIAGGGTVEFDGVNDYFTGGRVLNMGLSDCDLFIVAREHSLTARVAFIIKRQTSPNYNQYQFGLGSISAAGTGLDTGSAFAFWTDGTASYQNWNTTNPVTNLQYKLIEYNRAGPLVKVAINGVLQAMTAVNQSTAARNGDNTWDFQVGSSLRGLDAEIAEIIFFFRTLDAAERAAVESYLAAKWGL